MPPFFTMFLHIGWSIAGSEMHPRRTALLRYVNPGLGK
jgi:hypothetical protein